MFPNASFAVTVTEPVVPAVSEPGVPESTSVTAAAGSTVIAALVPVIEPVTVSVAVTVCDPAVLSV